MLDLDVNGWLMGPEFLSVLAGFISTVLIAMFNAIFGITTQ